ncbi:two component regulator three y domain-containing protein [Nitritalea halalkaliphila LW7]|uniref:Two component regulator three y domain-containing protein n=1 Tax=Nitritalea halalkaliphila LW7 TaxID=1189621 RepID=I5C0V3_9BACT|nr:two-component regulator propeller domain-containing protein [Nitritalea halalkaliphila]EIM75455.1 two component regulator three y domain-containing protein [Nitritalea halalkaliphila LW7]
MDLGGGRIQLSPSPKEDFITSVHVVGEELFILGRKRVYRARPGDQGDKLYREDITDSLFLAFKQRYGYLRKIDKLADGRYILLQGGEGIQVPTLIKGEHFICFNAYSYLEEGDSLLIGTSRGLKIYKADSLYDFSWNNQKLQNPVYALMRDSKGVLWMGTDRGVTTYKQGSLRVLDEKSGLAGSEVNRSALLDYPDKGVLIGTQFGLSVYRGQEDAFTQPAPKVGIIATRLPDQEAMALPSGESAAHRTPRTMCRLAIERRVSLSSRTWSFATGSTGCMRNGRN